MPAHAANISSRPKRAFFDFLGCRLNEAECQQFAEAWSRVGGEQTRVASDADVIVVNTCAVTKEAMRKSRQLIRKLHRSNPAAKLVATGCFVTLALEDVKTKLNVDLALPNGEKNALVEKIVGELDWPAAPEQAALPDSVACFARSRERAFVKIQDGCRYRCTYCIVTIARGSESSRPIQEVVESVNDLVRQGVEEIVLTGVHVGGYGSDLEVNLADLIRALLNETEMPRIRLASVEPWDIPGDFWQLFENPRLMPHLHLPAQSGSDAILRKMSRRTRRQDFLDLVNKARAAHPDFTITTDIIVGFPGETAEDFADSISLLEAAKIPHTHIFSFSSHPGTKAHTLPNHVDGVTKKSRMQSMQAAARVTRQNMIEDQVGQTVQILLEGDLKRETVWGYTPNYWKVQLKNPNQILRDRCANSRIVTVKICGYDAESLTLMAELF